MEEIRFGIPGCKGREYGEIVQAQIAPPADDATLAHPVACVSEEIRPLDIEAPWPVFSGCQSRRSIIARMKMGAESDCLNPIDARNVEIIVNFGLAIVKTAGGRFH
jgi:hypothetical protein